MVAVDDAGRFAVALCGGHDGGANALAHRVADSLGATPVVTTASDGFGLPALDSFGRDLGLRVEEGSDLAAVGAALVSGETVRLVSDRRLPLGPLPENVVRADEPEPPLVFVSDRAVEVPRPAVVYRPPSLVAGVGCSRGASAEEILGLLRASLAEAGLSEGSVAALASIDAKRDEAGLLEAAREARDTGAFPSGRSAGGSGGAQSFGRRTGSGRDAERGGGGGARLRGGARAPETEVRDGDGRAGPVCRCGGGSCS